MNKENCLFFQFQFFFFFVIHNTNNANDVINNILLTLSQNEHKSDDVKCLYVVLFLPCENKRKNDQNNTSSLLI